MGANKIKRRAIYFVIGILGCVVAWRIVSLASSSGGNVTHGPQAPRGSVLVNVTMVGYDPASIEVKAGQPIKLAFFRPNDANCGREVVFPDLGIRKALPPGQTVVVEITPQKSGPLGFACGMDMLKGELIVR